MAVRSHCSFRAAVVVALMLVGLSVSHADESATGWIVVYKNHTARTSAFQRGVRGARHSFDIIPAVTADLTDSEAQQMAQDPSVAYVEPDYVRRAVQTTTSLFGSHSALSTANYLTPYGVSLVHAPDVWTYTQGSGVTVASLDTGIDLSHPDLPAPTATTSITGRSIQDTDGHGTHTTGTMVALGIDGGVVGIAPQAGLVVAQIFDANGDSQDSDIIAGIDWAVQHGAKVINMSLGGPTYGYALNQACANAVASGVVLVAAAGNNGDSIPLYPAAYASVISVAAVDESKAWATFSCYGSTIDLSAPGVGVLSTMPVGTGQLISATWNGVDHEAESMVGSASGTVTARVVNCGIGDTSDFPSDVAGNIAHIRRGTLTFQTKVQNAAAAGAAGVIISNNVSGSVNGTLNGTSSLVVVAVSQADGDELEASSNLTATIINDQQADYGVMDGTSMATPHVSGVAALLFAARHGNATPAEVRSAMESTAQDLGTPGRDDYFGYGLVDAKAALAQLIPVIESASVTPTTVASGGSVTVTVDLSTSTGLASVTANGVALVPSGGVWTGSVPANTTPGQHTIDLVVSDNWGNTTHNTSLTYTTVAGDPPGVSIGSPSVTSTSTGPVSYTVTYTNATSVTLAARNVTLHTTGSATGSVSVSGTGSTTRTVTVYGITGNGTISISIAAGTASNSAGSAAGVGPSVAFSVSSAPTLGSVTPSSGSHLVNQWTAFTASYSDPNGVSDLWLVSMLINNVIGNAGGCHVIYSQNTNRFYMKNNSGTMIPASGVPAGTSGGVIETENAVLDCQNSTASISGSTITVKWRVKLKSPMAGKSCNIYLKAEDDWNGLADWMDKGDARINAVPTLGSVSPSSGSVSVGTWTTFTSAYSDPDGVSNLWLVSMLINNVIGNAGGCHVIYSQNTNRFYMKNNSSTMIPASGVPAGTSGGAIETENAILDCQNSTASISGSTITVKWRVKLKSSMAGKSCNIYLKAEDDWNGLADWTDKGDLKVQ